MWAVRRFLCCSFSKGQNSWQRNFSPPQNGTSPPQHKYPLPAFTTEPHPVASSLSPPPACNIHQKSYPGIKKMYFFCQFFISSGFTQGNSDNFWHCYVESLKYSVKKLRQTLASSHYMELLRTFPCCGILLELRKDFNFCLFFFFLCGLTPNNCNQWQTEHYVKSFFTWTPQVPSLNQVRFHLLTLGEEKERPF